MEVSIGWIVVTIWCTVPIAWLLYSLFSVSAYEPSDNEKIEVPFGFENPPDTVSKWNWN